MNGVKTQIGDLYNPDRGRGAGGDHATDKIDDITVYDGVTKNTAKIDDINIDVKIVRPLETDVDSLPNLAGAVNVPKDDIKDKNVNPDIKHIRKSLDADVYGVIQKETPVLDDNVNTGVVIGDKPDLGSVY